MFPEKLRVLGENFDVSTLKSHFPYKFALEEHLFYKGSMPSINYYEDIKPDEYNEMSISY